MAGHNESIGRRLKAAYHELNSEVRRAVRLPQEGPIRIKENGDGILIHLTKEAVESNMQTNAAAFEGWSLIFKLWLHADHVTLTWDELGRDEENRLNRHYARFLYRVRKFHDLFGGENEWFLVGSPRALEDCVVTGGTDRLCTNMARAVRGPVGKAHPEAIAECAFANSDEQAGQQFREHFGLERIERQFPVGVFFGRAPKQQNAVFTGGASAIDLVGLSGTILSVFELKARNNIAVGGLGELLFYAHLIRDTLGCKPRILVPEGGANAFDRRSKTQIRAVFLAPEFHPLFDHPDFLPILNASLGRKNGQQIPITFEMHKFCGNPETGYSFYEVGK